MPLSLKIHDVSVLYPGQQKGQPVRALSGVNLDIAAGDFVVALGASGCGKTTLLNLMAGFIQPSSGVITLGDYHGQVPERIDGAELRDQVTGPGAELTDLSPGVTYYVSVRVITPEGPNLSQYSPMLAVKTTGKASFAPPTGLAATTHN